MNYSDCKTIRNFCAELFSTPDWREVVREIEEGASDFEVDGVRFINSDDIDQVQQDELESDTYMLGCFNAWFIADVTGIDQDAIEAMQKSGAFDGIGRLIISMGKLEELQEAYARADGYGHHFNRYDGGEEELRVDGATFHVFDNH